MRVTPTTVVCMVEPEVPVTVTRYAPMVVVEEVLIVRVAATGDALATFTVLVALQVAGLVALVGTVVMAQLRLTVPVNPPVGETVMDVVLPVEAPAAKVMLPPLLRLKLGAAVTVTVFDPDAVL